MPETNDSSREDRLYQLAEPQSGYFRADQAVAIGIDHSLLRKHARPGGRYESVTRGVYRLRRFPRSPHDHVVAAWVAVGPPAVISHESALELQNLSDVIPDRVHLTLPRAYRGRRSDLAQLHFTQRPPAAHELRTVDGVPVTSPERTIVDALESGTQPEQVEMAVVQALDRGLTTPKRLERAAEGRSAPTRGWVKKAAARLRHT